MQRLIIYLIRHAPNWKWTQRWMRLNYYIYGPFEQPRKGEKRPFRRSGKGESKI